MFLYDLRGYYQTFLQYALIIPLAWALLYSGAAFTWWIASFAIAFILSVYGFNIGLHHTFSHKVFKFPRWFQLVLMYLGTNSALVAPISWCITHGAHHKYVDTELDPHSPIHLKWRVFFFMFHKPKKPDYLGMRHLLTDPAQQWFNSNIGFWITVLSYPLLMFVTFGITGLVFLWAIPTFFILVVGLIFSLAHYAEPDKNGSRAAKSLLLGIVSFGDGDHRKHHQDWKYVGWFPKKCALLFGRINKTTKSAAS